LKSKFALSSPGRDGWKSILLHGAARLFAAVVLVLIVAPGMVWACACGCGVFDVGTPSLIPDGAGGTVWYEFDFMNQYINWHSSRPASAASNQDKQIKTYFNTVGGQYMFNHDWGVMVTVPYTARVFRTSPAEAHPPGPDNDDNLPPNQYRHANFGDVRLWGMYTGLLKDMSLGLLVGIKTPSGDWTYPHFDRDTSIGTGSTDLLLGAYKIGTFPSQIGNVNLTLWERPFQYYLQGQFEYPFLQSDHYMPGKEFDQASGLIYNFGNTGPLNELAPLLTLYTSVRTHDQGSNAVPPTSGYTRMLLAPGTEIGWGPLRLYADVEFPVFQWTNGHQLTAPYLVKTILSYSF
jgi:hypothetical protein